MFPTPEKNIRASLATRKKKRNSLSLACAHINFQPTAIISIILRRGLFSRRLNHFRLNDDKSKSNPVAINIRLPLIFQKMHSRLQVTELYCYYWSESISDIWDFDCQIDSNQWYQLLNFLDQQIKFNIWTPILVAFIFIKTTLWLLINQAKQARWWAKMNAKFDVEQ